VNAAGFADILGRKYGTCKLPYNSSKSYIGTLAFFVFASLVSMGYVANIIERVNSAKSDRYPASPSVLVILASLVIYCQYTQPCELNLFPGTVCGRYVAIFSAFGFFTATAKIYFATVGVALASAFAESLPLPIDDNFTVPFTAMGVGMLLLHY